MAEHKASRRGGTAERGASAGEASGGMVEKAGAVAAPTGSLSGSALVKLAARSKHLFEIRDAEKVLAAAELHFSAVQRKGVSAAKLDRYRAQIDAAKQVENLGGRISLDDARDAVKDLLGDYRDAAELAATPFEGRDEKLAATLMSGGTFPPDDAALARYLIAVAKPLAQHSAQLAALDFSLAQQAQLAAASTEFQSALARRPDLTEELRKQSAHRARVLAALRKMTISVRLAGHKALKRSAERSDFDRPTPVNSGARAQAEARQAAREQQRKEAAAAKAATRTAAKTSRAAAVADRKGGKKK